MKLNALGLDLSIAAPGMCADDVAAETIRTRQQDGDARMCRIRDAVRHYARTARPVLAVLEQALPGMRQQGGGALMMLHGAVRTELLDRGVPYVLVYPVTLKIYATGDSRADKAAMIAAAQQHTGRRFADDNQADAWWLRQMGLDALGVSTLNLPQAQRKSLRKVDWPVMTKHGPLPALT